MGFKIANLCLLVLFPIAWFAPLLRAGLLPLFGLSEITIISGIIELWSTDILLAFLVILFALIAPVVKVIGTSLMQFGQLDTSWKPFFEFAGKLAMADIFLIALYVVIIKGGIGVGKVETAWGLYLFTGCVLASYAVSLNVKK